MARIVLVDDDRNILTSVSIALESEGYEVITFTDGVSALSSLLNDEPDLGVFDIKMPRMDGMELLRRLRKTSEMPVIFLTSKDDEIDEVLGLRMGADDYMRKPFSQRLLIERIKAILRRNEASEDNGAQRAPEDSSFARGCLQMDPLRHKVVWKDVDVSLTVTEFLHYNRWQSVRAWSKAAIN